MLNISREFLETLTFRPFNENDWYAFSGCETSFPLISESEGYSIIVDGNKIAVYSNESDEFKSVYAKTDGAYELVWEEFA